jgi:hypothetical protein
LGTRRQFLGLDIGNPDTEIRCVVLNCLPEGVEIALPRRANQMVVHCCVTFWQHSIHENYPLMRPATFQTTAERLAPVLQCATRGTCRVVIKYIDDAGPSMRVAPVAAIDHPPLAMSLDTGHAELATGPLRRASGG